MKHKIETSIIINSTAQKVWKIFSDFSKYPEWNPFVERLEGPVLVGDQINIQLPGMKFKPTVLEYQKNRSLRWKGKLIINGLFDGEHYFELVEGENGKTTFIHGENFSGILVGLFRSKLEKETKLGFESMNRALKQRVEELD